MIFHTAVREPNFDPWNSSVFQVVRQARQEFAPRPSLERSKTEFAGRTSGDGRGRTPLIDVNAQPRSFTTTCTQTDHDRYLGARPSSNTAASRSYNDFYQRLTGRKPDGHQTARDPTPTRMSDTEPAPQFRSGKAGASWRHVTQVQGNLGNHLCYIDGGVKERDMSRYPPYGYNTQPSQSLDYTTPRQVAAAPQTSRGRTAAGGSSYQARAKQGFKYWADDNNTGGKHAGIRPKERFQRWAGTVSGL